MGKEKFYTGEGKGPRYDQTIDRQSIRAALAFAIVICFIAVLVKRHHMSEISVLSESYDAKHQS